MKKIYLDYAAATPLDETVRSAMEPYFSERFFNPSALYLDARQVTKDVTDARTSVAKWLGARPGEIIFTAGGTEANNLAIRGVMDAFPKANLVVSAIEHDAVINPAGRFKHKRAPVNKQGIIDLVQLEKTIDEHTVLVSIMYANNEIGVIQPLREINELVHKIRQQRQASGHDLPLYFHTDACQAAICLDLHTSRLGVDLMTINGGKIYGPKQSGALYVKAGTKLQPQILGGGQELGVRSGTENVAGIIGLAAALELVQTNRHDEVARLKGLQKVFLDLLAEKLPTAVINGSLKQRLPSNVHITIPGQDNERLVMAMDEAGIQCAAGSACSASSELPSHVLKALGLADATAQSSLRFSLGKFTTEADVEKTVETLVKLVA